MSVTSIPNTEDAHDRAHSVGTDTVAKVCVHCGEPLNPTHPSEGCPTCGNSFADSRLVDDLREALGYTLGPGDGQSPFSPPPTSTAAGKNGEPPPDSVLGEFEVMDEIGRGGMGIVYRARQPSLGREVAIKILNGQFASGGSRLSRFRTETRAIARLNHPNIVPIYAQGETDSTFYYAMGLIEGCSLDRAIHQFPELLSSTALRQVQSSTPQFNINRSASAIPTASPDAEQESEDSPPLRTLADFRHLATLFADVADGLAHAHDQGVVHRDIKPQNLLLGVAGRIYISDFGLSRLLDEPRLTMTGELMGTPAYLSPEQVRGDESQIDHRTDIYSLGVTLYELLTARRPFRAKTRDQVVSAICAEEPARPRRVDRRIPRDLETICLRAIAKEPARRFATAHLLASELRRFAAGKPIQSKPPSLIGRVASGMRRHRGATGIGLMGAVCLALGASYAASVSGARRDEANQLLERAYEQLVYFDYRAPELVAAQVSNAEALGADPMQLNLVRALMSLGGSDNADAISRLRAITAQSDEIGPRYLLAWALWRSHESSESRTAFDQAAASGEVDEADEWFFRGLSSHFDRPELAIAAYKKANELRASQNSFFPQAVLHLARAYNQQMYTTRNDSNFDDADAILKQLIQQGHYRAYPHYLLSITQRLSGDIRQAAEGPESPAAEARFRAALQWARLGQTANANDERPITAEAECLERLGLFEEAIDARTRAIEVAGEKPSRCEGYHYRWRLNYWAGHSSAAQADIAAHAACMPQSLFYAHVYPSWTAAEAGDMTRAVMEARAIAHEAPDDAQAVIWSASSLRLLGLAQEAQSLLQTSRSTVRLDANLVPPQSAEWVQTLYDLSLGNRALDDVLAVGDQASEPRKLRAEAFFHAALAALGNGDRQEAKMLLGQAVNCFDSEVRYTFHARTLLTRMQMDPHWPDWLAADRR